MAEEETKFGGVPDTREGLEVRKSKMADVCGTEREGEEWIRMRVKRQAAVRNS